MFLHQPLPVCAFFHPIWSEHFPTKVPIRFDQVSVPPSLPEGLEYSVVVVRPTKVVLLVRDLHRLHLAVERGQHLSQILLLLILLLRVLLSLPLTPVWARGGTD